MKRAFRIAWAVFESICFAIGLFFLINVLTAAGNGSKITINKNEEQAYCFAFGKYSCSTTLSEETKHEQK